MADLAACYFCGTSAAVEEHRVVPERLGEDPSTVALCSDCATKWERAMDRIVAAAVDARDRGPRTTSSPDHGRTRRPDPGADEVVRADDPAGTESSSAPERGPGADRSSANQADVGREPENEEPRARSTSPTAESGAGPTTPSPSPDPGDESARPDEADPEDEQFGTDPFDSGNTITPSREATDRVVRLLQNRAFPIDQGEFVDVAANAYEIDPAEVRGVIELAIDRGHLRRDGNHLHRVERSDAEADADSAADADDNSDGETTGGADVGADQDDDPTPSDGHSPTGDDKDT